MTALSFDERQRHLLSGDAKGGVKLWSLASGGDAIRQFANRDGSEVGAVAHVTLNRGLIKLVVGAGWGRRLTVWADGDDRRGDVGGVGAFLIWAT